MLVDKKNEVDRKKGQVLLQINESRNVCKKNAEARAWKYRGKKNQLQKGVRQGETLNQKEKKRRKKTTANGPSHANRSIPATRAWRISPRSLRRSVSASWRGGWSLIIRRIP